MDLTRAFNEAAGHTDPRDAGRKQRRRMEMSTLKDELGRYMSGPIVRLTANVDHLTDALRYASIAFRDLGRAIKKARPKWGRLNWLYRFFVYISNL